jgi:hypothetical protein
MAAWTRPSCLHSGLYAGAKTFSRVVNTRIYLHSLYSANASESGKPGRVLEMSGMVGRIRNWYGRDQCEDALVHWPDQPAGAIEPE